MLCNGQLSQILNLHGSLTSDLGEMDHPSRVEVRNLDETERRFVEIDWFN